MFYKLLGIQKMFKMRRFNDKTKHTTEGSDVTTFQGERVVVNLSLV